MSDYEQNLIFAKRFCENFSNRNHIEYKEFRYVKIMLSRFEQSPMKMAIFSHQPPNDRKEPPQSTIVIFNQYPIDFHKEFKIAFSLYRRIGKESNRNAKFNENLIETTPSSSHPIINEPIAIGI